jgi:hypothetical protein
LHFLLIIHTGGLLQIKVPCSLKYVFLIAKVSISSLSYIFLFPHPLWFMS